MHRCCRMRLHGRWVKYTALLFGRLGYEGKVMFWKNWFKKKVSVGKILIIVPTERGVLRETLEAIWGQDYQNFKLMVYRHKPNPLKRRHWNCADAKEKARKQALKTDSEFFLFCDSDVVLPKNALSEFMLQAKQGNKIRYHAQGGWYQLTNNLWSGGRWVADHVFQSFTAPGQSVTITEKIELGCAFLSREIFEKLSFEDGENIGIKDRYGWRSACDCMAWSNKALDAGYQLYMNGHVVCKHLKKGLINAEINIA